MEVLGTWGFGIILTYMHTYTQISRRWTVVSIAVFCFSFVLILQHPDYMAASWMRDFVARGSSTVGWLL